MYYPNRWFPILKGPDTYELDRFVRSKRNHWLELIINLNQNNPRFLQVKVNTLAQPEFDESTIVFLGRVVLDQQDFGCLGVYRIYPKHGHVQLLTDAEYEEGLEPDVVFVLLNSLGRGISWYANMPDLFPHLDDWRDDEY